eukprot:g5778.t1
MAEAAKVRVGVRVRPLLPREVAQDAPQVISHPSEKQVLVDNGNGNASPHLFTYDHVFPVHASQRDLYASTAAQMLQPFLDGYNVTILAYGQTGSGKTYTMGSECGTTDKYDDERRGLIPRFLYDMFMNLDADVAHRLEATTTASFLEIYGEDVYDLLSDGHAPDTKRASLQVLEDKNGVFVNGLSQVPVLGWEAALDVLSQGVLNRTTASTLMNTVSSRSHAVFTITLTQTLKDESDPEGEPQTVTSKLTFVDLAGSERLGRTGAEGQRKREGIQINQGLLALGNVVNALGDDRPEKKAAHVPYRQSKLTRLLQDALGGNSQTLFIACVSPAADSINETVAALHYANRARNIKNRVVKNTDGAKEELKRLRSTAAALQLELVWEHFRLGNGYGGPGALAAGGGQGGDPEATGGAAGLGLGPDAQAEEVLSREEVKDYLKGVKARVAELVRKRQGAGAPLLLGPGLNTDPEGASSTSARPSGTASSAATSRGNTARRVLGDSKVGPGGAGGGRGAGAGAGAGVGVGVGVGQVDGSGADAAGKAGGADGDSCGAIEGEELDHDPEEELAVLDQLIEWQRQTGEYGDAAKEEEKRLEETDSQIREKESMLLKVRETLTGYHHMRERFDILVGKIGELEKEKLSLIETMKDATTPNGSSKEPVKGGGGRGGSAEALRERLKGVESQLASLGAQKKKQERAVMLLKREAKKCEDLQQGLGQLKRQKVVLQKRQQEAAKRHREYEQKMSREIQAMRKKNNKDLRSMSKMELEVRRQKAATARKTSQVGKMGDKLKKTEEHLLRLLALRKQQGTADRARVRGGARGRRIASATAASTAKEKAASGARSEKAAATAAAEVGEAKVLAAKHLLDQAVAAKVERAALRQEFSSKIRSYDEQTSLQVCNIGMLRDYRTQMRDLKAEAKEGDVENVDPGPGRGGARGSRSSGSTGSRGGQRKGGPSIGDMDTLDGQRSVLEALVQETEKAVDETQERLEMLGVDLDDMCRRLGMGDSFQGRSTVAEDEGGDGSGLGPREFKALEGLTPVEARLLVTSLVEDATASGIGDMLRKEEASKQAAEMAELKDKNKSMKDELFRLSQRYSRRMSMMKVDHTRDLVRLSMLDSAAGESNDATDDNSSCFGSLSGGATVPEEEEEEEAPRTPSGPTEPPLSDRVAGLGPVAANLFASPAPRQVSCRASWGGPRPSPRSGIPPCAPSPISSRDACEASANRRLSGQHMDGLMARQRQLELAAEAEKKRLEKVVERNRALTQDLQRERAERQRVQARLLAAERGAEGLEAESLRDTVAALEGVWGELGVAEDQRLGLLGTVASGVLREAEAKLEEARDERVSLGAKIGSLKEDLASLWAMLGKGDGVDAAAEAISHKPLRAQAEGLSKLVVAAGGEVCAGTSRRAKLRSAASAAVRVLELEDKNIGPDLSTLLNQTAFVLPRALIGDPGMVALSAGSPGANDAAGEDGERKVTNPREYLVDAETLSVFEREVKKLRAMQAEALAGYHEVRDEAREAVLRMDLSANEAFLLCKRSFDEGLVRVEGGDLDEDALDYACALLCRPGTTHVHVSRARTQHLSMAWAAVKLAQEERKSAVSSAQALVERAHREFLAASTPPPVAAAVAELEKQRREGSTEPPPPAYEAFLDGLSEDFPPLSKGVLEAFEGELMRIRHESLAAAARAGKNAEANRTTLREAGGTAAKDRPSEVVITGPPGEGGPETDGEGAGESLAGLVAVERLEMVQGSPGSEEWLKEAISNILDVWEGTREALGSLSVDTTLAYSLERRVAALEGVRASDQDICQLAQRMAELRSALDPARLSKRNKSSTHLLDAEKNRNACQAAYMRALKRLKEQLKQWREACGSGFDPSLLSDVARQALQDLRRGGGTGAKIEHILPHLDSGVSIATGSTTGSGGVGGGGGSVANSRAASPELHGGKHPARLSHDANASAAAAGSQAALTEPIPAATASSPELGGGGGGGAPAGSAMLSIANPGLVASSTAAPMSASKMGGGVQSFRGRGGAFGMLLHKVQTTHSSLATPVPVPMPLPGAGDAAGGMGPENVDGGAGGDGPPAPGSG